MEQLLIVVDLGRVRALAHQPPGLDPRERAHLAELPGSPVELHPDAVGEITTDQAGRFPRGGAINQQAGMSYGENHNLEEQLKQQALSKLAATIGQFVAARGFPAWRLVAPAPILPSVQEALSAPTRAALAASEPADLTRLPVAQLEARFLA